MQLNTLIILLVCGGIIPFLITAILTPGWGRGKIFFTLFLEIFVVFIILSIFTSKDIINIYLPIMFIFTITRLIVCSSYRNTLNKRDEIVRR